MQQPALAAQQSAISELRSRYERGDIAFEAFKRGLDALVLATNADECAAILAEFPVSSPSKALDMPPAHEVTGGNIAPPSAPSRMGWWVALMGGVNRTRRRWRLAEDTIGIALMGGIDLDLRLASLPPRATIRLLAIMGGANIRVPPTVRVTVRSMTLMGGVNAFGDDTGGMIAFGHAESLHPAGSEPPTSEIEIQVIALMGGVEVKQVPAGLEGTLSREEPLRIADSHTAPRGQASPS